MPTNSDFVDKLTGGPGKGATPVANPGASSFVNNLTSLGDPSKVQTYQGNDPLSQGRRTINLSAVYTDPLEKYTKYGVSTNPFNDWNEQRAQNQTTFEKWTNGLTKATITAVGSVYENTVGVIAGLGSLAFSDSHSYYDNAVGRQVDDLNNWAREAMPNYYTQQEINGSLIEGLGTANFWADKFAGGVGYTLGALATAWLGTGELGLLGKAGSIVGRGSKGVAVAEELAAAGNILEDGVKLGSKQKNLWTTVKAAGESKDVGKGLESLDRAVRTRTAVKRLAAGTNMSLAEASVESREAKNQFIEEQTAKWKSENPDQVMPDDVAAGIERSAYAAGNLTFGINLPILTLTNLLMFGKTLQGAKVGEKTMFAIDRDVTKTAGEQWAASTGSSKVGELFSKAQKNFGKPVESMFEEGFQEASQFAGSDMARTYYGQKFNDGAGDMSEALSNALGKTFGTKEGLENILIGALVGGGTGAMSRLMGAESRLMKMKNANTDDALNILNSGGVAKAIENAEQNAENIYLINEMEAAKTRNKKEGITPAEIAANDLAADKARLRLIHSVFNRLHRLGATDFALDNFDDLASMPEEEFKKALGYDMDRSLAAQTGGKSQLDIISDTKTKMELAIKRSEQVHNILSQFDPGQGLIQKIKAGMQSEQTKNNKLIEKSVRDLYGRMLTYHLLDIDTIDEHIDKQYDKLLELAPSLNAFKPEEVKFRLKVGRVTLDENGQPLFSAHTTSKADDKFNDVLQDIFKAKYALSPINPIDAKEFEQAVQSLTGLIRDRSKLSESFNNLTKSPENMDLYVEAQEAMRDAAQKKAADDRAGQAIAGSETADELRNNIPDDASPEVRAAAAEKAEQLEATEKEIIQKMNDMTDEELNGVDFDTLTPIEQSAFLKVQQARAEEERKKKGIAVSEQLAENNEEEQVAFTPEELDAAEKILSLENGTRFSIDGKHYLTGTGDPAESLVFDQSGAVIGVELVDLSTGNKVKWVIQDELDPDNPSTNAISAQNILKENARSRMLQYSILLGLAEIRNEEEVTTETLEVAEAKNDVKAEVVSKEVEQILTDEETAKEDLKAEGIFDPLVDIAVTAGLTAEQIRAQIESLQQDILEFDDILKEARIHSKSGTRNMNSEQFKKQPKIQELRRYRAAALALLTQKIQVLSQMKQAEATPEVPEAEGINTTPTAPETDYLLELAAQQIKRLKDIVAKLQLQAKEYNKIIDGTYPDQDVDAAQAALNNIQDKIARVNYQIQIRENIINRVNEDTELEQSAQNNNGTEGTSTATEGEESQGTDIDPTAGPATEGMDGSISAEEAERLRQEKLEALNGAENTTQGDGSTPKRTPTTPTNNSQIISDGANTDVQITKGELVTNGNGKVIVAADGSVSTDIPVLEVETAEVHMYPAKLTMPEVAPTGSMIAFRVADEIDWWKSETPAEVADDPEAYNKWMLEEGWKRVPILIIDENGETLNMLKAYDPTSPQGFQGAKRKEIVEYSKKGHTVMARVSGKLVDTKSISNTVGPDGKPHFYPVSDMFKNGQTSILYVGKDISSGEFKWRVASEGVEGNAEVTASVTRADNVTPGQIGVVTMNPSGQPMVIIASTKQMTEGGMTAALNHITKEEQEAYKYAQIVGCNEIEVSVQTEEDEVSTEDPFIASELQPENVQNFMMTYQDENAGSIFVFYSPTAKSLVRINALNLKIALLGGAPKFGFVQDTQNDQGYTKFQSVKQDAAKHTAVGTMLAEEFKKITMTKRFQVSKAQLGVQEDFTSPLTGTIYKYEEGPNKIHPYIQYLSNPEEFPGQKREEGNGVNAILTVDTKVNVHGSVFHDVNMTFGPLEIPGADMTTQENKAADDVADTIDSITEGTSTPTQPVTTTLSESEKFDLGAYIVNLQTLNDGNMEKTVGKWLEALSKQDSNLSRKSFNDMLDQVLTNPLIKKDADAVIEYTRSLGNKWFDTFSRPLGTLQPSTDPRVADIERRRQEDLELLDKAIYNTDRWEFPGPTKEKINARYDAELAALQGKPATTPTNIEAKKADIEKKYTFTRESMDDISEGTALAKKGAKITNPDKVTNQLSIGDKIEFFAERKRTGVWNGKSIIEDGTNNSWGVLGILSSTTDYIKNQSKIDAELAALGVKPATTATEEVQTEAPTSEEGIVGGEVDDDLFNVTGNAVSSAPTSITSIDDIRAIFDGAEVPTHIEDELYNGPDDYTGPDEEEDFSADSATSLASRLAAFGNKAKTSGENTEEIC